MKKVISIFLLLTLLAWLNVQAQEMEQSVYFEADTEIETELTYYKKQLFSVGKEDGVSMVYSGSIIATILGVASREVIGKDWGAVIGAGTAILVSVALTYQTDKRIKHVKTNLKLETKRWGEGKVQGYLGVEGKEECNDARISFYGRENYMSSYDIFIRDDQSREVKVGELLTFEDEQRLHLSESLTFASVGRKETACSMTLHQDTKISFEQKREI